jgi:NADH-quinone oxidoreductase subunit J
VTTEVWASLIFYLVAIVAIFGGIKMVTETDMIRAALSLVLTLAGVAVLYLLLSADFLAMVQVLVYVGAIMILMLFAIMLTPGQVELPAIAERGQRTSAALVSGALFVIALVAILTAPWNVRGAVNEVPTTARIGQLLMTDFVLPFEIASLVLTAAMVGAIVIARED